VFGKFVGKNNNVRMIATIYDEYQVYEGQTRHCVNLEKKLLFMWRIDNDW
jgi:hypothetical protein